MSLDSINALTGCKYFHLIPALGADAVLWFQNLPRRFSAAVLLGVLPPACGPGWRTHRRDCRRRCRTWRDESCCMAAPPGWSCHSHAEKTQKDKTTSWKGEEEHFRSHSAIKSDLGEFTVEDCLTFRLASLWNLSLTRPHQGSKWEKTFSSIFEFLSLLFSEQYKVFLRQQMKRNVCLGQTHKDVWQMEEADWMNTSGLLATDKLRSVSLNSTQFR